MSPPARHGLLPGISAYGWWVATVVTFVVFFAALAAFAVVSFIGFTFDIAVASRQPVLVYSLFAILMLSILMIGVTGYGLPISMRRELRAGYSTLASATLSVDVRDPRDGRVLLPAGVGPRRRGIRLGPLRRAAVSAAVDRPVADAVDEPPPIRVLDVPGRARGIPWSRKRLEAFESAVAGAVPDALLIGALREPLAEEIAARYRPGVRIHYTYLIAVRPSGLQLWQDPQRPALILEIPRVSIVDVLPKAIQNDKAAILGITIVIMDLAGIATELPFLPQRPQHPLLFVKSDDIEPLMNSMRRIWGMPAAE